MIMENKLELIVMLTHNDRTIANAHEIFEHCRCSKVRFYGIKEKGLPLDEMKQLFSYMKACGKQTVLEVVEYTEKECLDGAKLAVACGADILMGTMFFDSVNEFCKQNNLKYMPFVGQVRGVPSILEGIDEAMIAEAKTYLEKGVFGIDLLGYRYTGNAKKLIHKFVAQVNAPICIAGGINDYEKIDEIKNTNAWGFTIGGAFFEHKFGDSHTEQINKVYDYIHTQKAGD